LELVVEACFLLKTKPMVFLPNAYDVAYWGATYNRTSAGPLRMAIIAGYESHKNPESVIHALALYYAAENRVPLRVDWFGKDRGDGSYQRAEKLINHYGLSEYVFLNGEHTEVREVYRQSDFVGLFSRYEGLPNVLCESMLVGIPFVASRISDIPSFCLDDQCLCDPNSVQSISDSIRYMTSLSELERKALGKRYQTRAVDSYSPERVFKTLEEVIHV
jgi:glycosyltransferase involved in cell wall biosynthesis